MKRIAVLDSQAAQRHPLAEPRLHSLVGRDPLGVPGPRLIVGQDPCNRAAAAGDHEPLTVFHLPNEAGELLVRFLQGDGAEYRLNDHNHYSTTSAARTLISGPAALAHQVHRPRNVAASVL